MATTRVDRLLIPLGNAVPVLTLLLLPASLAAQHPMPPLPEQKPAVVGQINDHDFSRYASPDVQAEIAKLQEENLRLQNELRLSTQSLLRANEAIDTLVREIKFQRHKTSLLEAKMVEWQQHMESADSHLDQLLKRLQDRKRMGFPTKREGELRSLWGMPSLHSSSLFYSPFGSTALPSQFSFATHAAITQ